MENYLLKGNDNNLYKVVVDTEECPIDPFEDIYGDVQIFIDTNFYVGSNCPLADSFETFDINFKKIFKIDWELNIPQNPRNYLETVLRKTEEAGYLCLPIWGYSHGGYEFTSNEFNPYSKWDSGLAGFAWTKDRPVARESINAIIETINKYFNNEIYYVSVSGLTTDFHYDCGNVYEDLNNMTVLKNFIADNFGIKGEIFDYESFLTDGEIINTIRKMLKKSTKYASAELVNKLVEIEAEQMFR